MGYKRLGYQGLKQMQRAGKRLRAGNSQRAGNRRERGRERGREGGREGGRECNAYTNMHLKYRALSLHHKVYRDGHGLGSMAIHLAQHCFSFNMQRI